MQQLTLTAIGPEIVDTRTNPADLTTFDIILVNTSAGKDSGVMLDEVARLASVQGVLDRVVAVHADLGRSEWPGTTELAERQCAAAGLSLHVVRRTDGADLLDLVERRGMWPSAAARYCTSDLKRAPIRKLMTALAREHRATLAEPRPCRILNCMGLRAAESSSRSKRQSIEPDATASTKTTRTVTNWHPILHWSDSEVWNHIHTNHLEYHPAYDLDGVERLSCVCCVLASDAQLRAGIRNNPDLARTHADLEQRIDHRFTNTRSISDLTTQELP